MGLQREYALERPPQFSVLKAIKTSLKSIASAPLTFGGLCVLGFLIYLLLTVFETSLFTNLPVILSYPLSLLAYAALYAIGAHIFIQLFSMQQPAINRVHLDTSFLQKIFLLAAGFLIIQTILIEIIFQLLSITTADMTEDNLPVKMILTLKFFEMVIMLCLTCCFLVAVSFLSMGTAKNIPKALILSDGVIGRAILGHIICVIVSLCIVLPLMFLDVELQINDRNVNTYYTDTIPPNIITQAYETSFPVKIIKAIALAGSLLITVGICAALAQQKIAYLQAKAAKAKTSPDS